MRSLECAVVRISGGAWKLGGFRPKPSEAGGESGGTSFPSASSTEVGIAKGSTEGDRPSRIQEAMANQDSLLVSEIYASIQGESTFAGIPCAFVRTTGCNLRCSWCDTQHAFYGGIRMSRDLVRDAALSYHTPLVELTGGEPLLQSASGPLMSELCDAGRTVLLETSGEADISSVDLRVHKIVDVKCPGSGQCHRNRWGNLAFIRASDELKFVLAGIEDYKWMCETIRERNLVDRTPHLLASVVFGQLSLRDLVEWVLRDAVPVRVQVQLHKVIWGPGATGV